MGILNHIALLISCIASDVCTPSGVILHSCHTAIAADDIEYAKKMGEIVLDGLLIIAITVVICVFLNLCYRANLHKSNQQHELAKTDKDIERQNAKMANDNDWREKEHTWKVEYDDKWKIIDLLFKLEEKKPELLKTLGIRPERSDENGEKGHDSNAGNEIVRQILNLRNELLKEALELKVAQLEQKKASSKPEDTVTETEK